MADWKITRIFDDSISNVHHVGMEFNGNYYSVIFGRSINGGFCCIPNHGVGCDLAAFSDIFWNTETIGRTLNSEAAGRAIAEMIARA